MIAERSNLGFMCFSVSSASAATVARVYNQGVAMRSDDHRLTGEVVSHAFYLHALLADKHRRSEVLQVPHAGAQSKRYEGALMARNMRMVGTGQPEWAHACKLCEVVKEPAHPGAPRSAYIPSDVSVSS